MSIRVGVIGCGMISRFHFHGLAEVKATIAWVCDIKEEAAKRTAAEVGAKATTDWREIIADPQVQAVVVATISPLHKPICLAAIAAGKAVICEKSLATSADDALEIVTAAGRAGKPFFTAYMKRWFLAAQQAKALIPSLGRILTTHVRSHQPWGETWKNATPPRDASAPAAGGSPSFLVNNYGGGMLVMGGSHLLDLTLFLVGRPHRLYARVHVPGDRDYDLHATALMETPNNGTVLFEALASPLSANGFLRDGWDESVEITGTGGRLTLYTSFWNQVEQKTALLVHYDEATKESREYRYPVVPAFDRMLAAFVADIAAGTQTAQSHITGYEVDQLIGTINDSARAGQALSIPWRI